VNLRGTILYVEDDPGSVLLLKAGLRFYAPGEWLVAGATTLAEAVEAPRPDVVLCDLGLPDSDGIDTLVALQQAHADVPVVVLTAATDPELGVHAVRMGAADYHSKVDLVGARSTLVVVRSLSYALERARLRRSLAEARDSFQAIVHATPEPIWVTDGRGVVVFANKAGEALGVDHLATVHRQRAQRKFVEMGGRQYLLDVSATRWEGRPARLVFGRDMSEVLREQGRRLELERRVAQTERQRSLGRLGASLAHELNNALVPILAVAQAVGADERADLVRALGRVRGLTGVMSTFSQDHARPSAPIDLVDVVNRARSAVRAVAQQRVRLRWRVPSEPVWVLAVADQIVPVLTALLENGVEAGARRLTITVDRQDGEGRLVVEDDGEGIPEELVPRATEPFFTTRERPDAHGLGLASAKALVDRSGGSLRLSNRSCAGLEVELRFVAAEPPVGRSTPSTTPSPGCGTSLKVLLVDDDAAVRRSVARMLKRIGHAVDTASDGLEALDRYRPGDHQIVVTDVRMPNMNGTELVASLRMRGETVPVLLITGHSDVRLPEGDAIRLLLKPFAAADLASALSALVVTG